MKHLNRKLSTILAGATTLFVSAQIAPTALADDAAAKAKTTADATDSGSADGGGSAAATGSGSAAAAKIRYKKQKQVDFSSKTIEGKLKRPETALITASEGLDNNGILRLRENFLDKFAADAGEEVP